MLGVLKVDTPVPLATGEPPVRSAYQSMVVPAPAVAEIVTVPVPHLELFTGLVGGEGSGLTIWEKAGEITVGSGEAVNSAVIVCGEPARVNVEVLKLTDIAPDGTVITVLIWVPPSLKIKFPPLL